jgi:hypothetical protein
MNILLNVCYLISSYIRTYLGTVKIMLGMLVVLLTLTLGVSNSIPTVHMLLANDPWNG